MTLQRPVARRIVQPHHSLRNIVRTEIQRLGRDCDLNHLDVSAVTSMAQVFSFLDFQGDISQWDVSNVHDMESMFQGCSFNGNISQWNVRSLRKASGMFQKSSFNGDISNWDTARLMDASRMFMNSQFNGNVAKWDVQNVQDFSYMFYESSFAGDISPWKFSSARDVRQMLRSSPWRGALEHLKFTPGLKMSELFEHELANEFAEPNVYHWYLGLGGDAPLKPEWHMMLSVFAPSGTDRCASANELHFGWQARKRMQTMPDLTEYANALQSMDLFPEP